jgi:acyl-coenzyme A thioesterase 13
MAIDFFRGTDYNIPLPKRVEQYLNSIVGDDGYAGFDKQLLQKVKFTSIDPATKQTLFRITVEDFMCNKDGNLHGGAATTILDNLSSTSLLTVGVPGFWDNFGVSRSLIVIFHKGIPRGMDLQVECTVVAVGRKMATMRAVLKNDDGTIYASCVHEKFAVSYSKI